MSKDLFSKQSATYAKFRPHYPAELFEYILQFVECRDHVWDCATGNGQAARELARYFRKVEASDISASQITHAVQLPNIEYHVCPAEKTPFEDNRFDLITVATAYHWLHWKEFSIEASRVGKPGAVVAIWAYNLLKSEAPELNDLIGHFYYNITAPYWDPERKYVDASYSTVDFDFDPLPSKEFEIKLEWTKEQLTGFLESWSAVQNYRKKTGSSPLTLIGARLDEIWKDQQTYSIIFPVFLRIGRVIK